MGFRSPALLSAAGLGVAGLSATGLGVAAIAALGSLTPQPAAAADACPTPMLGRYAVMGMGVEEGQPRNTPTAHLLEERWLAGGALEGRVAERRGRSERSTRYRGTARLNSSCVLELERRLPWGTERSEVVLDGRGRPLYSLKRNQGSVVTSRWLPMAPGSCRAADLNGLVLSSQVGLNWSQAGWKPNAVVQREQWRNGSVAGLALASYAGQGETATYSGNLRLEAGSCWGDLQETDARGTRYSYRALLVKGRSGARGYFYLQNNPDNLTAGWLVRD